MSERLQGLLTDVPSEPKEKTHFGFVPAIEFRRDPPIHGELVEMAEDGRIVGHWGVPSNSGIMGALHGQSVTMPPGFPECTQALRDAGAFVTVHPRRLSALQLAESRLGGIDWI